MTAIAEELIVVAFAGQQRAAEVLARLQQMEADQPLAISDAVAVYRTVDGYPRITGSVLPTPAKGAQLGALLGALLGCIVAAVAATGIAAAAAIGAAVGALLGVVSTFSEKEVVGISSEFVRQTCGLIPPGHSAVFLLGRTSEMETIAQHFRGSGGTILRTTLPTELAEQVQTALWTRQSASSISRAGATV